MGIYILSTRSRNTILDNKVYSNNNYGIELKNSTNNLIKGNIIYTNSNDMLYIFNYSISNFIIGNQIYKVNDGHSGLYIFTGGQFNVVSSNKIHNNNWGIYVKQSSNNYIVSSNQLYQNAIDGIELDQLTPHNYIKYNNIFKNGQNGIILATTGHSINIIANQIWSNATQRAWNKFSKYRKLFQLYFD